MIGPGAVLDETAREAMLTSQRDVQGLGWILDDGWFRHGGDNEGFTALMVGRVESRQAAVVMANATGAFAINEDIVATIAEICEWPDYLTAADDGPARSRTARQRARHVRGRGGIRDDHPPRR